MLMTQYAAQRITLLPIAQTLVDNLVMLAKAFAEAAEVKITTVGTNSTKTASFYVDLENGLTSCTLRKYDLLTDWFSEHWPVGHIMPKLIDPTHYPTEGNPDVKEAVPRQSKGRQKVRSKSVVKKGAVKRRSKTRRRA